MIRVDVSKRLIHWAIERSGASADLLHKQFPMLPKWLTGERQPTFKQLETFAQKTHSPIGYFFLSEPPDEPFPIPDFRTIVNRDLAQPSPNLLDTIYLCQQRQEWYRDYACAVGEKPLPFVGSAQLSDDIIATAETIRKYFRYNLDQRTAFRTWTGALRHFIDQADQLGILVMVRGFVGSNNKRKLNPEEFRGFTLADQIAPLIFINGADTKSALMFTLAHELAHLWLGETALSDVNMRIASNHEVEKWCDAVAAEILVPLNAFNLAIEHDEPHRDTLDSLALKFKVSTFVILKRLYDADRLNQDQFCKAFDMEKERLLAMERRRSSRDGGSYYRTTTSSISKRFAHAVVVTTWKGHTSFTEAYRLLGCRNTSKLREISHSVGVDV